MVGDEYEKDEEELVGHKEEDFSFQQPLEVVDKRMALITQ